MHASHRAAKWYLGNWIGGMLTVVVTVLWHWRRGYLNRCARIAFWKKNEIALHDVTIITAAVHLDKRETPTKLESCVPQDDLTDVLVDVSSFIAFVLGSCVSMRSSM